MLTGLIDYVTGHLDVTGDVFYVNIMMLYLMVVLAIAAAFDRGPAVLASVASFLACDWSFVEPVGRFAVSDPEEWVALLLFLLTAVATAHLTARQRRQAREAGQREREVVLLCDAVCSMRERDLEHALHTIAERLRLELQLAAVVIELADGGGVAARAVAGESEMLQPQGLERVARLERVYSIPVVAQDRQVGRVVCVLSPGMPGADARIHRLLAAVSVQLGLTVERVWLRRGVTEAEVLRRTDELKSALLNAVSHDLRTPLTAIIASADSLLHGDEIWTGQERQQLAGNIKVKAQRLTRIVENLLDLSRIEAGSLRPERRWYDLGALVDDVLDRMRSVTAQHRLLVDVPEDLPPVPLDYVEIDQVLSNLIENATKYSPPNTQIRICARRKDGEVQLEVADRGPGIPPPALPHLFEPFYRADGRDPGPGGAGVGLAIARGLVEAHGGRIWAENRSGGGARFAFTLPLSVHPERPSAAPEGRV
ncbi:MAG: ATP-binding protein [Chloroflexota bacterium]|nr:ATP-binding protein [Chloroflexota bacterium]